MPFSRFVATSNFSQRLLRSLPDFSNKVYVLPDLYSKFTSDGFLYELGLNPFIPFHCIQAIASQLHNWFSNDLKKLLEKSLDLFSYLDSTYDNYKVEELQQLCSLNWLVSEKVPRMFSSFNPDRLIRLSHSESHLFSFNCYPPKQSLFRYRYDKLVTYVSHCDC